MYRRAYSALVATSLAIGLWAIITAQVLDKRLIDPEGSFLGPSWLRLPILCLGALLPLAGRARRGALGLARVTVRPRFAHRLTSQNAPANNRPEP